MTAWIELLKGITSLHGRCGVRFRTLSEHNEGIGSMKPIAIAALLLLPAATSLGDTQFDGYYVGSATVIRGGARNCRATGNASWQILNGLFAYTFWAGRLQVQVSADGTLNGEKLYRPSHGAHSWVRVKGAISDGSLEADVEWRACQLHYSLRKV
jgi:hypothetical protein